MLHVLDTSTEAAEEVDGTRGVRNGVAEVMAIVVVEAVEEEESVKDLDRRTNREGLTLALLVPARAAAVAFVGVLGMDEGSSPSAGSAIDTRSNNNEMT